MKAYLKDYRQSPRKVRLVTDLVRGKKVDEALKALDFVNKKAAQAVQKLIRSAKANAVSEGKNADSLVIKSARVDEGTMFRRYRARARGVAAPIQRRNSHIHIELGEQ